MVCNNVVTMVTIMVMNRIKHGTHSDLIDSLGGTVKVADLCRVSSQAVSKWRREGIPEARLMFLQAVRPEAAWCLIGLKGKKAA